MSFFVTAHKSEYFFRMSCQSAGAALNRGNITDSHRPAGDIALPLLRMLARAHKSMLKHWQRVLPAAGLGKQPIADRRRDLAAVERGGIVNCAQEREIVHARKEILAAIDGLGEALEASAGAEIVRA